MKNKKSKIVVFMLIATMILTMNLPNTHVYADIISSSGCTHDYRVIRITEVVGVNMGVGGHCNVVTIHYQCRKCFNLYDSDPVNTPIEAHITIRTDWHSGSRHYARHECTVCEYTTTESWECPGNPCINYPNRILIKN